MRFSLTFFACVLKVGYITPAALTSQPINLTTLSRIFDFACFCRVPGTDLGLPIWDTYRFSHALTLDGLENYHLAFRKWVGNMTLAWVRITTIMKLVAPWNNSVVKCLLFKCLLLNNSFFSFFLVMPYHSLQWFGDRDVRTHIQHYDKQ
jgi:hypothetical protein